MDLMKAAKESFPINILVSLILGIVLGYFVATYIAGSSGKAIQVVPEETVLAEIQAAIPKFEIINIMPDFNACLIVNMGYAKYSYQVAKTVAETSISINDNFLCNGEENEDFIVSYVSYVRLKTQMHIPPSALEWKSSNARNYYILPSKEIAEGFTLKNPDEFNTRFSGLVAYLS